MKKDPYVKWTQWGDIGVISSGEMRHSEVQGYIRNFEQAAKTTLDTTGAAHVVYARKLFDENGKLEEVRFYLHPMTEEEFDRNVATLKHNQVYALHRR